MSVPRSIAQSHRPTMLTLQLVIVLFSIPSGTLLAQSADHSHVRVVLADATVADRITMPANGAVLLDLASGSTYHLDGGSTVTTGENGKNMRVAWGSDTVNGRAFRITAAAAEAFRMGSRSYAGTLELRINPETGQSSVTNVVPLEEYVAAVVSAEYGLNDTEGTRAMAIVARTYALAVMQSGGVLRDDERSQVYRGQSSVTSAARRAANDTAGYVLMHKDELVEAVYSSSNGGYTASNSSVWDTPARPYLAARKDPFDAVSPHSEWHFDVDKQVLHDLLSRRYGASIREVRVLETAADGRVRSVELRAKGAGDRVISGTAFRAALASAYGSKSARSTFFSLNDHGQSYRLNGRGFGHGVGLSQWGAHGRALDGQAHEDILAFYYPGSQLVQLSPVFSPDDPAAVEPVFAALPRPGAPSQSVSDGKPVTQEKKSGRILDAHSAWGRAADHGANTDNSPSNAGRRVGW